MRIRQASRGREEMSCMIFVDISGERVGDFILIIKYHRHLLQRSWAYGCNSAFF